MQIQGAFFVVVEKNGVWIPGGIFGGNFVRLLLVLCDFCSGSALFWSVPPFLFLFDLNFLVPFRDRRGAFNFPSSFGSFMAN